MWPHTVQCAGEASINCSQMWTPSYTPRVPPWYVSRIFSGQLAQYLGGQQPRRYQGWRKLQISSILAQNFWVVDCGCRWVGWRCYWAATRLGEKEKCRRSTFQSTSTYRSLPVCLSGSEQPARRIFLVIRKDIFQIFFFQDGERGDKCRGAGGADQGAGAGEHEPEVPAGQIPDHLCLAGGDGRQTGNFDKDDNEPDFLKAHIIFPNKWLNIFRMPHQERQRRAGRWLEGWAYLLSRNPSKTSRCNSFLFFYSYSFRIHYCIFVPNIL